MKSKPSFIAEIDANELAVRMCEASYGLKRPPGASAKQALEAMDPESRDGWRRAAHVAMEYWQQCIAQGQNVS